MGQGNKTQTWVSEFILLGLSSDWGTQVSLFVLFLAMYLVTIVGNALILLLIRLDSRLHTPMYFFLSVLSLVDLCYSSSIVPQMLVPIEGSPPGSPSLGFSWSGLPFPSPMHASEK